MKTSEVATSKQYPKRKRVGRFEDYIPLNTSRDVILHKVQPEVGATSASGNQSSIN